MDVRCHPLIQVGSHLCQEPHWIRAARKEIVKHKYNFIRTTFDVKSTNDSETNSTFFGWQTFSDPIQLTVMRWDSWLGEDLG